ncbi:MAG: SdrD B-like domain-containing protein, partial [Candidatus Bathyarchaeia archaeon]
VGTGLIAPSEPENATEQAIGHPVLAAEPVAPNAIDLTKPENAAIPTNATNVTKATALAENKTNITITAPAMPAENKTNITAPAVVKFSIMGKVTDDNQTGLADVKVNIEQPAKTIIADTTTSKDGNYSFPDLMPGDYVVSEVLPANWTAVTPADGLVSVTLMDKDMTVDFVNKMMPASIPAPAMPAENQTNTTAPK